MTTPYTFISNLSTEVADIQPDSIISKTVYDDEQVKIILFGFAPGQSLSEHTASKPAMLHFLAGEATLTLGDDSKEVQPGAWARMSPNLSHSIHAKTTVLMLLHLLK